jgi:putative MFS transporter
MSVANADFSAAVAAAPTVDRVSSSIAARMERLPSTATLWRMVVLISLGGWFELYELFATGYIAPGLVKSGILTSTTQSFFGFQGMGAFIAATFAGLFIGTFFLGFLSDRYGRRFVFTYSLIWYTAATVVMAFQTSAEGLLLWRFIAGIGIGVEIVTIDAYLTEIAPRHMRGRAFALNQAIMFSSVPVVALISYVLVPSIPFGLDGWRSVILIGAAGAVVIWFIRRALPESPLWLAQNGREDEADRILGRIETKVAAEHGAPLPPPGADVVEVKVGRAGISEILKPPYRGRLIMLVIFNFCQVIGYYGFANWVPTLLAAKGIEITKSLLYSSIIAIANPMGPMVAMSFADRVQRKWVIVGAAAWISIVGIGFASFDAPVLLILCGVLITLANTILSYAYHAYQTEVFPVRIRGRAAGLAYSSSRIGAVSSGFLIAFFLKDFGVAGVFALVIGAMLAVIVSIGVFGPTSEQLAHEGIPSH